MADFGLTDYDANVLTADLESAAFFESVAKGRDGKQAANWVINELFGRLKKEGHDITESPVAAAQLGGIIDLIAAGTIPSGAYFAQSDSVDSFDSRYAQSGLVRTDQVIGVAHVIF